jgi:hypothetical protein
LFEQLIFVLIVVGYHLLIVPEVVKDHAKYLSVAVYEDLSFVLLQFLGVLEKESEITGFILSHEVLGDSEIVCATNIQ